MVLDREFAVSDALNFKAGIFTDVLNEIMIQTAPRQPVDAGNDSELTVITSASLYSFSNSYFMYLSMDSVIYSAHYR